MRLLVQQEGLEPAALIDIDKSAFVLPPEAEWSPVVDVILNIGTYYGICRDAEEDAWDPEHTPRSEFGEFLRPRKVAKEINEIFSKGFATAWFSALPGAVRATVILSPYRPEADEIVTWSADGLRYTWATPGKEPRSPTQSSFEYGLLPKQQRPDQEDSSHRAARALLLAGCAVHPVEMALLYRASVLFVPARRLYDEHVHLSVLTLYRLDDAVQWARERGGIRIAEPRGRHPDQPRRTLDDIAADSPQRIVHRGPRWKTLAERGIDEEMDVARKILAIARTISLDDARVLWSIIVERLMKQADRDARDCAAGVLAAASAHQRLAMETLFNRLLEM